MEVLFVVLGTATIIGIAYVMTILEDKKSCESK
jgi:hypothetical protein